MSRTSKKIADSWPASIDDAEARKDWNWKHEFDLESDSGYVENLSAEKHNTFIYIEFGF
jgi:hypothetical protein